MLIAASAQLILATAVSGWSPNSPATRAAQPRTPTRRSVVVTARRIWSGEGDADGCRVDRNNASARTASNVPRISRRTSDVFFTIVGASLPSTFAAYRRLSVYWRLSGRILSSFFPASADVFKASAQPEYLPAGIKGLRSAGEDQWAMRMASRAGQPRWTSRAT